MHNPFKYQKKNRTFAADTRRHLSDMAVKERVFFW